MTMQELAATALQVVGGGKGILARTRAMALATSGLQRWAHRRPRKPGARIVN